MKQARRKSGRLSDGKKVPMNQHSGGLDWDKQRREYAEKMAKQWEEGNRDPDTIRARWLASLGPKERAAEDERVAKGNTALLELGEDSEPRVVGQRDPKVRPSKQPTKVGFKGRVRTYDEEEIVRLYLEENMMPKNIALRPNMPSSNTVINVLKRRQVFDPKKFRQGWMGAKDGKNPTRPKESYTRQKHCGVCGTDLDKEGNSEPLWKTGPDGIKRPNGRDCIPCRKRRNRSRFDG